jgi:hypothetical protein
VTLNGTLLQLPTMNKLNRTATDCVDVSGVNTVISVSDGDIRLVVVTPLTEDIVRGVAPVEVHDGRLAFPDTSWRKVEVVP